MRISTPSVILRSAATKNLKQIRSEILRFAQNDRWGCFPRIHRPILHAGRPPTFPAASQLRGSSGAKPRARERKARRENKLRRMGFQREGRLCKKPFLWRAFLPLLSARAERRGPRRAFPRRGPKKTASRKPRERADVGIGPYGRGMGRIREHSSLPVILRSDSDEESKANLQQDSSLRSE